MGIFQNSNLSVGTLTTRTGIAASPLDYAGLVIWLDSYDPNTITGSANTVTTWSDKSGGGRHFTQATAAARPTYQPASFNGLPSINFNGSSNFLTYSGGVSYNRFTVFGVLNVQNNATMQTQDIFSKAYFYALGTSDFPFRGISAPPTVTSLSTNVDGGGDYVADRIATSSAAPNTNYIFTSYHDQTNLIATLNGVTGQTTPSTVTLSSTIAPYAIGRAGLNNGGGTEASYYKGNMAELIMYNVALTAAQQANIRSYLSTKWRIPIS